MTKKKTPGPEGNAPDPDDILFGEEIVDEDELNPVDEDEERKERAAARQKKLMIGGGVFTVVIIVLLAYLAFFKKDPVEEQKVPDNKPVALQLVNRQQVEWANSMCAHTAFWGPKMRNKVVDKGVVSPVKGRDEAVKVLKNNAQVARSMNEQIVKTPDKVYETSVADHRVPSVLLIERKDGDEPDEKNVKNTETVRIAIDTYANSLDNIVKMLQDIATYDDKGLREGLSDAFKTFNLATDGMDKKLGEALSTSQFDNTATISAIANLPLCGDKFVGDDAKKKLAPEIEQQNKVMNFVKLDRCTQFTERNNLISEQADQSSTSPAPSSSSAAPVPSSSAPKTITPKTPATKPATPAEVQKALVDKAIISVYNQDVTDCAAVIASPGVDTNDPLFKNGVSTDTNDMVTPQIPEDVAETLRARGKKVGDDETKAYSETPSSSAIPTPPVQQRGPR